MVSQLSNAEIISKCGLVAFQKHRAKWPYTLPRDAHHGYTHHTRTWQLFQKKGPEHFLPCTPQSSHCSAHRTVMEFLHCFRHSSKELWWWWWWGRWKLLLAPGGQCSCLQLEAFSRFPGELQNSLRKPPWDWFSFQTNRWTKMNFYSKMAVGTWPRNKVSTEVGLRPKTVLGDRPAQWHQGSVPPSFKGKASALVNSNISELSQ